MKYTWAASPLVTKPIFLFSFSQKLSFTGPNSSYLSPTLLQGLMAHLFPLSREPSRETKVTRAEAISASPAENLVLALPLVPGLSPDSHRVLGKPGSALADLTTLAPWAFLTHLGL
jgi:hypothetical protein